MEKSQKTIMGMLLDEWTYKSCTAHVGTGDGWATIYDIESEEEGKGHATKLLAIMKAHYEKEERVFGSSVALNPAMEHLLKKLNIYEYQ